MCQRYYCGYTVFSGCKFETVENFQQILELKLRQTLTTEISEEKPPKSLKKILAALVLGSA